MVTESIQYRYRYAEDFDKPTVMRDDTGQWLVVGPGFRWLGDDYPTWEAAIRAALNGR